MRAMQLVTPGAGRLTLAGHLPLPLPGPGELRLRVLACGVCRTDLHVVDGELAVGALPLVPGHQIVGRVDSVGAEVSAFEVGQRVGVTWLAGACGLCVFCRGGRENLCGDARFTGWTRDGGYADFVVADARFVQPLPPGFSDVQWAPLLCAGVIGHRAYRMVGAAERLGLFGFGAAGHIVAQVAVHQGRRVFAFTRPGDREAAALARELGAVWAGGSDESPPEPLDGAIIFASHGPLVPAALERVERGGTVVCAGIHMSDVPSFPYRTLWGERVLRSVAHVTREDARQFLALAPTIPVTVHATPYPLEAANAALADLRAGRVVGAAVLVP